MNYIIHIRQRKEAACLVTSNGSSKFIWFSEYKIMNLSTRQFDEFKPYLMGNHV